MIITFYGSLGERLGRSRELAVPAGVRTVGDLRGFLGDEAVLDAARVRVFVDDVAAGEAHGVCGAGRIDFLPPLSGG